MIKIIEIKEGPSMSDPLIRSIAKRLEIVLASPEHEIIRQGVEDSEGMFFIHSGQCDVIV